MDPQFVAPGAREIAGHNNDRDVRIATAAAELGEWVRAYLEKHSGSDVFGLNDFDTFNEEHFPLLQRMVAEAMVPSDVA